MVREYGVDDLPDTFDVDPDAADQALARLAERKTAPTTGADEPTIKAGDNVILRGIAQDVGSWISDGGEEMVDVLLEGGEHVCEFLGFVYPATAVPDAELRASIRDVKEVAMDASREHGFDLSQPLARIDAWLAHGGRDGN